jgi:hypothetical protein
VKFSWILVAVLVLVLVMSSSSSSSASTPARDPGTGFRPLAPGEAPSLPPGARPAPSSSDGLVDKCHQGFTAGTSKVLSSYGAGGAAKVGAQSNPYYYACDAGGYVIAGAKAVGHFFGSLF